MAWDTTMIIMLRSLIGDLEKEEYTDPRLKQIIVVAAQYVNSEIRFDTKYTVNIAMPSIAPDPTIAPDDPFVNLTVLKAACMIDRGNMRIAAMSAGIEAKCGPAVLKTLQRMEGFKTLIDSGYCAAYEESKREFQFGNTRHIRAILSPFINSDFDPMDYMQSDTTRMRG